jgi:hypothetical protein
VGLLQLLMFVFTNILHIPTCLRLKNFVVTAAEFINICALTNAGLLFEMLRSTRKNSKSTWKVFFSSDHFY